MPGHLARRFQQIAVAVFMSEVEEAGYDLTPVQYAALAAVSRNPGIDQATLAGLIAYDRTTITGVVERLTQKGLVDRHESARDRRARELQITEAGRRTLRGITPKVEAAQRIMLRGLTARNSANSCGCFEKAIAAGNELSRRAAAGSSGVTHLRGTASSATPNRPVITTMLSGNAAWPGKSRYGAAGFAPGSSP